MSFFETVDVKASFVLKREAVRLIPNKEKEKVESKMVIAKRNGFTFIERAPIFMARPKENLLLIDSKES